jgi:hypothetical protein
MKWTAQPVRAPIVQHHRNSTLGPTGNPSIERQTLERPSPHRPKRPRTDYTSFQAASALRPHAARPSHPTTVTIAFSTLSSRHRGGNRQRPSTRQVTNASRSRTHRSRYWSSCHGQTERQPLTFSSRSLPAPDHQQATNDSRSCKATQLIIRHHPNDSNTVVSNQLNGGANAQSCSTGNKHSDYPRRLLVNGSGTTMLAPGLRRSHATGQHTQAGLRSMERHRSQVHGQRSHRPALHSPWQPVTGSLRPLLLA